VPTARINRITTLNIRNNDITDLTGIQDFVKLVNLNCSNNRLTSLDMSGIQKLEFLNCSGNQLTNLDVSFNTSLINLDISGNSLTDIDISQNSALVKLNCSSNQLTSLDILQNINLNEIFARFNKLFSVDANNGFNQNISKFDLSNNPNLTCILVDDITEAEGYPGWSKDKEAQYKLECNDDDNDGIVDEKDDCPATPFGDPVDLFGCSVFRLPIDNFSIVTTGETCRTSNNGKINVAAVETHNYTATLIGNGEHKTYKFTNTVEIRNVRAESYELCLTIESQHDYKQCYTLVITEPEDLIVLPIEGLSGGRIAYELSGAFNYIIDFNGLVFETTDNYISLALEKGKNTIRIKTGADCQGVFEETIFLSDDILLFPNPFKNYLHVNLGDRKTEEIQINIYSTSGFLVRSKKYQAQKGSIDIETSSLASGVYVIDLRRKDDQTTFKIVKE
ncbi:MAG: T9SS type A sorting domain-containing protein, partial [Cyclobacteriaceae bacterium]|nr:T9SS type A sorting domain-containing protein [Cyclobacteriaceae bacterium]